MHARIAGVLLLLLALVAAVAVPALTGKPVAGTAVPAVIADPPAVGSCVGGITYPGSGAAGRAIPLTLPVATVVPCTGQVSGEVIAVTARQPTAASPLGGSDQVTPSCRGQVEKYLGATATTVISGVEWNLNIDVDVTTVGPDAHDQAAGRTWSACVLSAAHQTYPATPLRSSWQSGTLPDAFGLCWADGVVQQGVSTNCTSPHHTQQIGYAFVAPTFDPTSGAASRPPARVADGCRALAATVLRVADPTRGGALTVKLVDDTSGAPYVQCAVAVTGKHELTGSLIGIGNRPLPLT